MPAPQIKINTVLTPPSKSVAASSTVTFTLDSTDGVRTCVWEVISTDETSATSSYTLVQSGSVGQTCTTAALGAGTAALVKVKINGGIDPATGLLDPDTTIATAKFYVPLANGLQVGCAGEEFETDATVGTTGLQNAGIRAADALSGGALTRYVRAATTAALPANTRTGNVITADANGALPAQDGVTMLVGDKLLVQFEGGGAAHINNGPVTITSLGSGGTPFVLTRATDFNETTELVPGVRFYVQEGTLYSKKDRVFVTTGASINVTALQFESAGYASGTAAYLENSAVAANVNGVPMQAIATKLRITGASGVIPLVVSHLAATGSVGTSLEVRRSIPSGVGSTGTGARLAFTLPDYGSGADIAAGTMRVEATAGLGTTIVCELVLALPNGAGPVDLFTLSGDGTVRFHGSAYASAGGRFVTSATGVLSLSAITFDEVKAGLAAASSAVNFNSQNLTGVGDLTVGGNLVVSGTTTTVNSTAVSLADRLLVFNSSTGIVVAPVNIAGFVVDRGSTDGVTKRDQPGVFWDEANSRFDFAFNTAGDQSTIGTFLTVKLGAVLSDGGIDTATAAVLPLGATNATAVRLRYALGLVGRNAAGGADLPLVRLRASIVGAVADSLIIGDATVVGGTEYRVGPGVTHRFYVDTAEALVVSGASVATDLPLVVNSTVVATNTITGTTLISAVDTVGEVAAAIALDFGTVQRLELSAKLVADSTVTAMDSMVAGATYRFTAQQHASSAKTITWPSIVGFASGDDAMGATLSSYTTWEFEVLSSGALICTNRKANIIPGV